MASGTPRGHEVLPSGWPSGLQGLARQYGVQRSFYGLEGQRYTAQPDVVLAVLRELGAQLDGPRDIPSALRARHVEYWGRLAEPVAAIWNAGPAAVEVRVPATIGRIACSLEQESGKQTKWTVDARELPTIGAEQNGATRYERKQLILPADLTAGYHRLDLQAGTQETSTLLIVAPLHTWHPDKGRRSWGIFTPLYALSSSRSWGAGDVTDLGRLASWTADLGGQVVATLPLLALALEDDDVSPYAPVSRLFWNELYLDVERVLTSGLPHSSSAAASSADLASRIAAVQAQPLVDYHEVMQMKRTVLADVAQSFFQTPSQEARDFDQFSAANPTLIEYARFRAVWETLGTPWQRWPERLRRGDIRDVDADPRIVHYHQFVQWQADQQIKSVTDHARADGVALYFDLPVGSRGDGFDVWASQELFAPGLNVGAPPDPGFPSGQTWGFPPIRPDQSRADGHRYFIASLRHQLANAGMLRLDHVMSLHRLYCIPEGADKLDGVYVRYPWEEYYAILAVESHRHQAVIVGEDLGIVPREVRAAMARHRLDRTWVLQFELMASVPSVLHEPPATSVAAINTHDMPTFASLCDGSSHEIWQHLAAFLAKRGVLNEPDPDPGAVFRACLDWLAASNAEVMLVNLEDLWLERDPQNVPASPPGTPNWRRKARHRLETIESMVDVRLALTALNQARLSRPGRKRRSPFESLRPKGVSAPVPTRRARPTAVRGPEGE